jgi:rfaE bifunctional protein nucleotidyltransferase chain/domain/rfaE bifunctional protein kinase chain/domain
MLGPRAPVTAPGRLTVVGDTLLDRDLIGHVSRLCPDAPVPVVDVVSGTARPGGAGLAALLAAGDGRPVTLVTAIGQDAAGAEVAALLDAAGVDVVDLGLGGATPEKVRARAGGHALLRMDHGGPPAPVGPLTAAARAAMAEADAVLVADYGRGLTSQSTVRRALADGPARRPVVWDPHPRGSTPTPGARLVTSNRAEAGLAADARLPEAVVCARRLAARWRAIGVAVTLGDNGAVLVEGGAPPLAVPAPVAGTGDPCGAGDRFASTAAGLLADGALPSEAVTAAVAAASAFVAAGGAAGLGSRARAPASPPSPAPVGEITDPVELAAQMRAAGGTVVATGGCFDLLHAGHVSVLQAARALGDCLIVCLNSDVSVRRLKGPGRPVQAQADRARLLTALSCVDGIAIFDDDTPVPTLEQLRPHVFAKGADYDLSRLPEAAVLESWGGQTVVLPYLEGRSTTRLMQEATNHGRS